MKPVIVIRPQPGCDASMAGARALGLEAHGFALFEAQPLAWDPPDPAGVDALLFGSANVLRHGGAALDLFRAKPVYSVGEATAQAARTAGFDVVETGGHGLQELLQRLKPGHRRLLRLAGRERVGIEPPEGVTIIERTVYASEARAMPDALAAMLARPAVVLIHSGVAASHFAACCRNAGIDRSAIALAAISERAAAGAGDGWSAVGIAQTPDEGALLALARQMCEERDNDSEKAAGSMQDKTPIEATAPVSRRARSMRGLLLVSLLAFVLGCALVGWLGWKGYLNAILPDRGNGPPLAGAQAVSASPVSPASPAAADSPARAEPAVEEQLRAVGTVEARLAMLEDRFSRLDLQASAASGNAARAEGLLIAFATRRMIDRGEPLRYLADQLRLRFADAQPRAVRTIIEFSENPVTIDALSARLEALEPQLTRNGSEQSLWQTIRHELGDMFILRRDSSRVMTSQARIDRARVMLTARRIPEAIEQVRLLPGAEAADKWIGDAQRFAEAQSALDLIETAAMLEPSRLKDSEGKQVDQPSPITSPVELAPAETKQTS